MRKLTALAVTAIATVVLFPASAIAGGNLAKQQPIEVRLDLGKDGIDKHRYYPDKLTFETGKLYKLVIHNPNNSKHYFTSMGFAHAIWTRKVQIMDDLGAGAQTIAEVKGPAREVEVYPGGTTEWWFVPVATGTFTDLRCSIKDKDGKSHGESGMTGVITIN